MKQLESKLKGEPAKLLYFLKLISAGVPFETAYESVYEANKEIRK